MARNSFYPHGYTRSHNLSYLGPFYSYLLMAKERRKTIWSELESNPIPLASQASALNTRPWLLGLKYMICYDWLVWCKFSFWITSNAFVLLGYHSSAFNKKHTCICAIVFAPRVCLVMAVLFWVSWTLGTYNYYNGCECYWKIFGVAGINLEPLG